MKIRYLTLANFRGIKEKKLDLSGDKVAIYGRNGTGKTTVDNAITYLLTDAAGTGEKAFSPKTEGAHKLNHVATMTVVNDQGEEMTISKDFHEVWKKKRGASQAQFTGHETDYFINGVPAKKKEYEGVIKDLCGGDAEQILMLTHAGYFAEELAADKRRKILVDICGDISDKDILAMPGICELNEYLPIPGTSGRNYSPEEFLQIAKVKRRDLNKKLDELPARIDEISRTISPEKIDAGEIEAQLRALNDEKASMLTRPQSTTVLGLEAAIAGFKTAIEKGRAEWLRNNVSETANAMEEIDKEEKALRLKASKLNAEYYQIASKLQEMTNKLRGMEDQREKLLAEFESLRQETWDAKSEICPTCGQKLPADTVRQLRENWLEKMAEKKAEINRKGKEVSKEAIAKVKSEIENIKSEIENVKSKIENVDGKIKDIVIQRMKAADSVPAARYEDSEKYKNNMSRIEELTAELETAKSEDIRPDTSEITEKIETLQEKLAQYRAQASARERAEELQNEMKETSKSLDYYDKGIALCEEFFRAKMEAVSERVSEHFETVGWRLYKEQINGGLAECCEPLLDNGKGTKVEWKSANTAAQINGGLEIIEVLSKHYNKYLPVIVDRAESVTDLRPMPNNQVIKLVVSKDDKDLYVVAE